MIKKIINKNLLIGKSIFTNTNIAIKYDKDFNNLEIKPFNIKIKKCGSMENLISILHQLDYEFYQTVLINQLLNITCSITKILSKKVNEK